MGLISKEVEVALNSSNIKRYEDLGYEIPRYKNKWGRISTPRGTKIKIKIKDLLINSHIKVLVKCDNCRSEYKIRYQDYNKCVRDDTIYCKKCSKKLFMSGKNHPNWNLNKTDEEREIGRCYPEYTEFIKKVLIRDNYTCKCCGKKSEADMQVHHLDGYDWCKKKRTDETNGITLCETCHMNFHMKYSRGNNTKEQFEEWYGQVIEVIKYEGELPTTKKIYCIEEDKIYDSVENLIKEWGLKFPSNIYYVCNRTKNKNGSYLKSIKGKHLLWLDEYEKYTEEDIKKFLEWCKPSKNRSKGSKNGKSKSVICITTNRTFDTITSASSFYKIKNSTHISSCCTGKRKSCGKLEDGTPLQWMYYEDYKKQNNKKLQESA